LAPLEAAVVADVNRPVRADGRAVRAAAQPGDDLGAAVPHARQRAAGNLDEHDRAIAHCDGSFRELQSFRDDVEFQEVLLA
jgi:hypothetical protein